MPPEGQQSAICGHWEPRWPEAGRVSHTHRCFPSVTPDSDFSAVLTSLSLASGLPIRGGSLWAEAARLKCPSMPCRCPNWLLTGSSGGDGMCSLFFSSLAAVMRPFAHQLVCKISIRKCRKAGPQHPPGRRWSAGRPQPRALGDKLSWSVPLPGAARVPRSANPPPLCSTHPLCPGSRARPCLPTSTSLPRVHDSSMQGRGAEGRGGGCQFGCSEKQTPRDREKGRLWMEACEGQGRRGRVRWEKLQDIAGQPCGRREGRRQGWRGAPARRWGPLEEQVGVGGAPRSALPGRPGLLEALLTQALSRRDFPGYQGREGGEGNCLKTGFVLTTFTLLYVSWL